jgi:hypothetical protein
MPAGGKLVIETENAHVIDDPRTIQEVPPEDYVRVSVSDNGQGIGRVINRMPAMTAPDAKIH